MFHEKDTQQIFVIGSDTFIVDWAIISWVLAFRVRTIVIWALT